MITETWVKLREMLDKTGYTEDGIIMCIVGVMQEQQEMIKQQDKLIRELIKDNENHGRSIDYIEKVLKIYQV